MNTFRKLSLIALVGISTAPVHTMDAMDDLSKKLHDATQEAVVNANEKVITPASNASAPVTADAPDVSSKATPKTLNAALVGKTAEEVKGLVKDISSSSKQQSAPSDVTPEAKGFIKKAIEQGANVIELATDHKYCTAGIAAFVTIGCIEYFVFKNGHIKTVKEVCKNHSYIFGTFVSAAILAGGAYAADQKGYINLTPAKEQVSTWGSSLYNQLPNKPSLSRPTLETAKSWINWKTGLGAAAVVGLGYVVNKYRNGNTEIKQPELKPLTIGGTTKQPSSPQAKPITENKQDEIKPSWKLPSLFGGSKVDTPKSLPTPQNNSAQQPLVEKKQDEIKSSSSWIPSFGFLGGSKLPDDTSKQLISNYIDPKEISNYIDPKDVTSENLKKHIRNKDKVKAQAYFDILVARNNGFIPGNFQTQINNIK